jgi:hypothetical protein
MPRFALLASCFASRPAFGIASRLADLSVLSRFASRFCIRFASCYSFRFTARFASRLASHFASHVASRFASHLDS